MHNKVDLTVSIVTFCNDSEELSLAVTSILKSEGVTLKLYILDNSPTDCIGHIFNDPRIEYIFNNKNIGFGAGHNVVMRKAVTESRYHLNLNPDIYFDTDVLAKIIIYMDKNPSIGQLLPKVLAPDGTDARSVRCLLPSPYILFLKSICPFKKYNNKRVEKYLTRFASYDIAMPAPFLSGCFIFLRSSIIEKVGCFDERFFMYYEDVDLSRRIYTEVGNIYYPEVNVTHIAHRESHKNWKLTKIHLKSAIQYYNKWGWFDSERNRINNEYLTRYSNLQK